MYKREIEEVLDALSQYLDVPKVQESIHRPWRHNSDQWLDFMQSSFPQQTFNVSETVNNQTKSYTFRMTDGLRERMIEQILDWEEQIRPEMVKALDIQGSSLIQRMRDFVQQPTDISWDEFLKGRGNKGFWKTLFRTSQAWHDKPVRRDSLYRILWVIVKN